MLRFSRTSSFATSDRARRFRRRARSRGFSHVTQTIEAAAVMAWFVLLVIGEKFVGDATSARRSTEDAVKQSSVSSECQTATYGVPLPGAVPVTATLGIGINGVPQLTSSEIPSIIAGLGLTSLRTLPVYFKPFQSTTARAAALEVTAGAPLNFRSGTFEGVRSLACLEPSLDSPGAPWVNIEASRTMIYVQNVLGYR
jgi:hypothetical protein